ncbi:carboxylesterase/lipase family protein [Pseudochryseolinea flava]|uniref:Carboxylic ester hydrolase n=1 Tax=Pseudochryseolinea flava TaxID=2059302 RepID=A0A364Y702_9BACT|nr:carboxylesterase family protein [Pseudochryseolinea flava]RAW02041.1 carboxylesterase/lipase family protein [Pseudochryseolinea flava]
MKALFGSSINYIIVISLFFHACSPVNEDDALSVNTSFGKVSGLHEDSVFIFKGIPYAKAERFMVPQDPDRWEGIRECVAFGPVAKQVVPWINDSLMNEKELFSVNVWTRGLSDGKKRPVMFWLHGGGFHVGSSSDPMTDGKALAKKGDVVVVSVNHRLNILGFLDLSGADPKYAQSANVGMLDVVKALEWTRDNIKNFGGDPSNVTIFGESGGGGKVGTLMCMPSAKGLFHKAIIQSGTLINVMTKEKSQGLGLAVLKTLGIATNDLHKLDTLSYHTLLKAGNDAIESINGKRIPGSPTMFGFAPSADGEVLLQQPFTPGFASISNKIPLVIGTTLNELIRTAYSEKDLTLAHAKERLNKIYNHRTDDFVKLYSEAYPDFTPQDLLSVDTIFRPFTIRTADAWSAQSSAPVYSYFLSWKSPMDSSSRGSFHGLDVALAFDNVDIRSDWTGTTKESYDMADKMSSAWINFAKTGSPSVVGKLPAWEPYTVANGSTMIFDRACVIRHHHDRALMKFIKPLE